MARQRCVMTALVDQVDPQTVLTRFPRIAGASSGLVRTDLPQSELGYFADLALKTRTQKIKSVNFVPPLIKPWDYDADFVRRTVRSTIAASEKSTEKPRTTATARPAAAAPRTPKPASRAATSAPAKPAADPATAGGQASEADLSAVCST
jgi:hypothetical protein